MTIEVPPARVGEVARVSVTLEAPAAATGVVAVGLPPGAVLADAPAGLRQVGDTVELAIERADQGAARRYEIPVRSGFAGALQSAPHRIVLSGAEALLPPSRWEIRPAGGG